ncbi:MAG: protein-disulfide reductase DsbD family protein [Phycisphaerales bacterium]|jgi:thiol:disulfide interchange protein DsbD|nr:protein-disulfide reductase DsbD family protein [Phycisphaerales bacterium]
MRAGTILMALASCPAAAMEAAEPRPHVDMAVSAGVEHASPGEPFELVTTLHVPKGSHIYWRDPGSSGMPTRVRVTAPAGCRVGPVRFPRPVVLDEPSGRVQAHEGTVHFAVAVTPPASWPMGTPLPLTVRGDWLICRSECWLGKASVSLDVPVGAGPTRGTPAGAHAAQLPPAVELRPGTTARIDGGELHISGPVDAAGSPGFLLVRTRGLSLGTPSIAIHQGRFMLTAAVAYDAAQAEGGGARLQGLLTFGDSVRDPAWAVDLPIPQGGPGTAPHSGEPPT